MLSDPVCPLCASRSCGPSWYGSSYFRGREFVYLECRECRSLFCHPMPDDSVLELMYSADVRQDASQSAPALCGDDALTRKTLSGLRPGVFVDYGCGAGGLLAVAQEMGFEVAGIEWDSTLANAVSKRLGVPVFTPGAPALKERSADVLHLGDVIEHLTELDAEFPRALRLLKPGGALIAQGPLQANTTLFNWALRMCRPLIRRFRNTEIAPEHVILATLEGQLALFRRFGLSQERLQVWETNWPAPETFTSSLGRRPRELALYLLAEFSRVVSRVKPGRWGNRYFYVGRMPENTQAL